jgi:hypothetical protein
MMGRNWQRDIFSGKKTKKQLMITGINAAHYCFIKEKYLPTCYLKKKLNLKPA